MAKQVREDEQGALPAELLPAAQHVVGTVQLALEKAVGHAKDPKSYPLAAGSYLEQALLRHFQSLGKSQQAHALSRFASVAGEGPETRRARYGNLAEVDLRRAISVVEAAVPVAPRAKLSVARLVELLRVGPPAPNDAPNAVELKS